MATARQPRTLTAKQRRFVDEFLLDSNATQAAIRAGYSPKSAEDLGRQLLRNPRVKISIAERQASKTEQNDIKADDVLRELAVIGFSSIEHYTLDDAYHVICTPDAPAHAIRAVRGVKYRIREQYFKGMLVGKTYDVDFTLWNKNEALRDLGKYWRLFVDRFEITQPIAEEIQRLAAEQGLTEEEVYTELKLVVGGRG